MKETKLLICDEDEAYVHALVLYLIGVDMGFTIKSHTRVERLETGGEYDIGLMTDAFIDKYEKLGEGRPVIGTILHLAGSKTADNEYETLYKYQSMDKFVEKIKLAGDTGPRVINTISDSPGRVIGMLSPAHHELLLPYAVTVSKILGESARTLLLDLEQCSILTEIVGKETVRNLTDLMYLIISGRPDRIPGEYLGFYESFYYLVPPRFNLRPGQVGVELWSKLLEYVSGLGFENIVVVYDAVLPGMEELISASDEIFLVEKPGGMNAVLEEQYKKALTEAGLWERTREICIPGSAQGAFSGKVFPAQMMFGALASYFRNGAENAG